MVLDGLEEPNLIRYRQRILKDCLAHSQTIREMYRIPNEMMAQKRNLWLGVYGKSPTAVFSGGRRMLAMLTHMLEQIRQIADEFGGEFNSPGFRQFSR